MSVCWVHKLFARIGQGRTRICVPQRVLRAVVATPVGSCWSRGSGGGGANQGGKLSPFCIAGTNQPVTCDPSFRFLNRFSHF